MALIYNNRDGVDLAMYERREMGVGIDGITLFKSHVAALRQELAGLQHNISSLPTLRDNDLIDSNMAERGLETIHQWARTLPLDEQVLAMIEWEAIEGAVWWLIQIRNSVNLAAVIAKQRLPDNESVIRQLAAFSQHLFDTAELLRMAIRANEMPIPQSERAAVFLSPGQVIAVLKIEMFWVVGDILPGHEYDKNRLIPYHPYHTERLIRQLILSLNQRAQSRTRVSYAQTTHFFEITLTIDDLHLRPETWQTLIDEGEADSIEFLREVGGEIAPLVSGEGVGEGVVVRLPWSDSI